MGTNADAPEEPAAVPDEAGASLTSWTAPAGTTSALEAAAAATQPHAHPYDAGSASRLDVARALLTGGEPGISVWNARRSQSGERLDLSEIELKGVNLSNADLSNCVLRCARLSGAVLFGAKLDASDLSGADLTNARLEGASLRGARLLNARANGASFRFCDLASADLRNANFERASLSPAHLASADLTGAQFSSETLDEMKGSVSSLESSGDHPRRVFFALVGLCAFSALTAVGASEVSLVAGLGEIKVPLLDTAVSPRGFFFVAPVVCVTMMLYVAAHVRQLERAARELPARFTDGATLAEKLTPWMQNVAPAQVRRRPVMEDGSDEDWSVPTLSRRLLVASTRWIVPVTTTAMLVAYFRSRRPQELALMAALVLCTWLASYFTWRPVARTSWRRHASFAVVLGVVAVLVWNLGRISGGPFQGRGFDLKNVMLTDVQLRGADLSYADLGRAALRQVDLSGAILIGANLGNSGGHGVTLYRSRLNKADLRGAFFADSDFGQAQMVGAQLGTAELRDSSLRHVDFARADLTEAQLRCVDLRGADLSQAKLDGLQASALWCDDAHFPGVVPPGVKRACDNLDAACRRRLETMAR